MPTSPPQVTPRGLIPMPCRVLRDRALPVFSSWPSRPQDPSSSAQDVGWGTRSRDRCHAARRTARPPGQSRQPGFLYCQQDVPPTAPAAHPEIEPARERDEAMSSVLKNHSSSESRTNSSREPLAPTHGGAPGKQTAAAQQSPP